MTEFPSLRADCAQCAALCCVAFAFDKSASFSIDKPACQPCPHLEGSGRCAIHDDRDRAGFGGCVTYDCLGAGQRVTRELFDGRSWQTDHRLLAPMCEAFLVMGRIHAMLELLKAARALPLDAGEREQFSKFLAMLQPSAGWSQKSLSAFPATAIQKDVNEFLRTLQRHVSSD